MKLGESLIAGVCGAGLSLLVTHATPPLTLKSSSDSASGGPALQRIDDEETVEGEVVDLYDYMVGQDAAESGFLRRDGRLVFPEKGPIGLIVTTEDEEEEDDGASEENRGTDADDGVMHVIVFDPSDERARAAYHRLQQMPGESVTLDASLLERDGILGCVIRKIEKEEASPAGPLRRDGGDGSQGAQP